ncbi:mechanosensitive ion channel family protein [Pukyongiella litopenaei]|uniref:Mechanosensitive ion channel family protein n=1 Tax=Pukyongiella litopenaei TaxID=2605946 RepID=A0A2S0MVV0_9RHOB|nr:mechanosensitive ion channel family protein [Pukyongiella litopenaei]AVO39841.1 mechanosensitive ion channel family protein [Pukyongiella litopenaei]
MFRAILLWLVLAAGLTLTGGVVHAQGETATATTELPDPLTREAVHELVARMSDDQVRQLLLERLDAVAEAEGAGADPSPPATLFSVGRDTVLALGSSWLSVITNVPTLLSSQAEVFRTFAARFAPGGLLTLAGFILVALAAGYAAERGALALLRRWWSGRATTQGGDLWGTVRFLFRRFRHELLGLAVFYVVTRMVGRALIDTEMLQFAAPFMFYLVWIPRLGAAVSRFVLAPDQPKLRLVNANDRWARYLHRNLIGLFLLTGFTIFIVRFNVLNGMVPDDTRFGFWLNTAVHIYIMLIAWTARSGLVDIMRGPEPDLTRFEENVARRFPHYVVGVSVVMWLVFEIIVARGTAQQMALLGQGAHYSTMFWLILAPLLDTLVRGVVQHVQPPIIGSGPTAQAAYRSARLSYVRVGRVIVWAFALLMVAAAWNINLRALASQHVGESLGGNLIEFALIAAVGYIVFELVSLYINRRLAREQTSSVSEDVAEAGGEGGGAGGSRLATVLPLLLVSAQTAIAVIFGLLAIGALGIDITPLLAGAGILGLAIGFGAQKLVTDVVSGIFFLIDDAFRVGEYVDVDGSTRGTVEKISIRSMQLRHHRGLVHTIPYGEIPKLTNYSRDWVIMKLMFTVTFDTDPNKVKKIFKKIGAEMMEDPLYKDDFLEPFKSQGVFQFDDVGIVMRGKFMAKPGTQFTLRKEIYNRVRREFAENGIEFARREVRVAIPGLEDHHELSDEQKTAVGAAAAGAVQSAVEEAQEQQGKT